MARPEKGAEYGYLAAAGYALLLLVSVLVHEAAHALVARWRGHPVERIVADVWGGHTVYDASGSAPGTTAVIAVVGPLANLALAGIGLLLQPFTTNDTALLLLTITTYANLLVGLFNLLPGLPLDGGQIVSALVWKLTGRRGTGFVVAGWLGRLVALATVVWFVVLPLARGGQADVFAFAFPVVIAVFLWQGATGAIRAGRIHDATADPAASVLEPLVVVPASTTLTQVDEALASGALLPTPAQQGGAGQVWLATSDARGWPDGVVEPGASQAVPQDARHRTPLSAVTVAQPGGWVVAVTASDVLTDLIRIMSERSLSYAVVVDSTSRSVLGLATAERINAVVGARLARRGRR